MDFDVDDFLRYNGFKKLIEVKYKNPDDVECIWLSDDDPNDWENVVYIDVADDEIVYVGQTQHHFWQRSTRNHFYSFSRKYYSPGVIKKWIKELEITKTWHRWARRCGTLELYGIDAPLREIHEAALMEKFKPILNKTKKVKMKKD